jgi:hypothetical protein
MRHPFLIVLRSCLGRWQSWLILSFWALQLAVYIPQVGSSRGARDLFPMLLFAVGYTCAAIGVQAKEHLGSYRAALVPRFKAPHLVAAVLWLVVTVAPFAMVTALRGGSALGVLGLTVPLGALAFAACCRGGWRAGVFGLAYVTVFVPAVTRLVAGLLAGEYPWAAGALVLAGLWFLGDALVFLATMDEETPGYEMQFRSNLRQFSGPQARRSMFAAIGQLERQKSIWLRIVDVQIPEVMPYVGASRWRRLAHWRRAHANWWMSALMPSLVWLVVFAVQYGLQQGVPGAQSLPRGTLWVLTTMPPFLALSAWQARAGMLGRELLYPLRRRDFLVEQALSVLVSQYAACGLLLGVMALVLVMLPSATPWPDLWTAACIAVPWQLVVFGLLARLGTLGSGLPMVVGLMLAAGAGSALLIGCVALGNLATTATVTVALMLLAGASLAGAYRHWLRVDIV